MSNINENRLSLSFKVKFKGPKQCEIKWTPNYKNGHEVCSSALQYIGWALTSVFGVLESPVRLVDVSWNVKVISEQTTNPLPSHQTNAPGPKLTSGR